METQASFGCAPFAAEQPTELLCSMEEVSTQQETAEIAVPKAAAQMAAGWRDSSVQALADISQATARSSCALTNNRATASSYAAGSCMAVLAREFVHGLDAAQSCGQDPVQARIAKCSKLFRPVEGALVLLASPPATLVDDAVWVKRTNIGPILRKLEEIYSRAETQTINSAGCRVLPCASVNQKCSRPVAIHENAQPGGQGDNTPMSSALAASKSLASIQALAAVPIVSETTSCLE